MITEKTAFAIDAVGTPMIMARSTIFTVLLYLTASGIILPASYGNPLSASGEATQLELLQKINTIRATVDSIRFEMGKPRVAPIEIRASDVEPRELYYLAYSLLRKTNRLTTEVLNRRYPETSASLHRDYDVEDVSHLLNTAQQRMGDICRSLDISNSSIEAKLAESSFSESSLTQFNAADSHAAPVRAVTLHEAEFFALIQANRELNDLLHRELAPEDVFEIVTTALSYSTILRSEFPGYAMPETPPFQRGKRPVDVYKKLLSCMNHVRSIAQTRNLHLLELTVAPTALEVIEPEDVSEIASLLVAELAGLHAQLEGTKAPYRVFFPGIKLPSHVYQRAALLERQLIELLNLYEDG